MGFEPFHDYDQISEEQAAELREALADYRKATDDLLVAHIGSRQVVCAKRVLESHLKVSKVVKSVNEEIYTEPAMVHVAGEIEYEHYDEFGVTLNVQRCERCGSVLMASPRDDTNAFFDEGDKIAKKNSKRYMGRSSKYMRRADLIPDMSQMYFVGHRDLEKHELECVSLRSIFEET